MDLHVVYPILDASHVGQARREAVALASKLGLAEPDVGRVAVVVIEAVTNIVKHAGKGRILLRPVRDLADRAGIEMLALDQGPGMADVVRCMRDGYSTAGSPGTGLGAISRLASFMDVYSIPSHGTAMLVRVLPQSSKLIASGSPFITGAVRVAYPGEPDCGDDWSVRLADGGAVVMLADGLGHGNDAAKAAGKAVLVFDTSDGLSLPDLFRRLHEGLLTTRGAAVSIAELDLPNAEVRFAGAGNVAGFVAWPGGTRAMVSHNGTVGGPLNPIRVFSYPWTPRSLLVMHTDGLNSHTSTDPYPGLLARHPGVIAGVLYRDFARGKDDATVVVVKTDGGMQT